MFPMVSAFRNLAGWSSIRWTQRQGLAHLRG